MTESPRTSDEPLAPDDLELPADAVRELDRNRYVVDAADGGTVAGGGRFGRAAGRSAEPRGDEGTTAPDATRARYAFELVARTEDGVERTRIASNDVREAFDDLLLWYAARVATDRPPERTLSVLARESELLDAD